MSTTADAPAVSRPSFADAAEIDDFVATLARFERGEIDSDQWRAYRVARGAYSQRQAGPYMLRVKVPQGLLDAAQLRALAEVAVRHSRGFGHVTTRQNFQLHFVSSSSLEPALRRLAEAGLTTSGAGGNTVRNVVACPFAGVAADEAFDVTPHAEQVTRLLLRHSLGDSLPRKFKIAFEGCPDDHVRTPIHDLGFRAVTRPGPAGTRRGFRVTAAGGTSTACTSGFLLAEFLPEEEVPSLVEAVIRVFHAHGDRKNKQRNRLKFLVRDLGEARFRELVDGALQALAAERGPSRPAEVRAPAVRAAPSAATRPASPSPGDLARRVTGQALDGPGDRREVVPAHPSAAELRVLRTANVREQSVAGLFLVAAAPPQGDLTAAQLDALADLAEAHGDGTVRLAPRGQVHLRDVRGEEVEPLLLRLAAIGLDAAGGGAADPSSCPGAEVCRLAVTNPRGAVRAVTAALRASRDAGELAAPFPIHASGCPNGCSHHHVAAIGLQGGVRRAGDGVAPQYAILVGGHVTGAGAHFGRVAARVPASRVAEAVVALHGLWVKERRPGEEPGPFLARAFERAREVIAPLEAGASGPGRPEDLVEPGSSEPFVVAVSSSECAAASPA